MRKLSPSFAVLALALAWQCPGQAVFHQNLVVNGGAENGEGATGINDPAVRPIPGWTASGSLTVVTYGANSLLAAGDPGPQNRGLNYFSGGPGGGASTARQTIDLSALATDIDGGRVRFYLSGFLGSADGWDSPVILKAAFRNAAGEVLLTSSVNGPSALEKNYTPELMNSAMSGYLLPNTRSVDLLLDMTAPSSAFNYFGADNLSLILRPESVTGVNLVVNGGAETAETSDGLMGYGYQMPGWTGTTDVYASPYDDTSWEDGASLPADRGKNLFYAAGQRSIALRQTVDLTLLRSLIEAGAANYRFSAWLGTCAGCLDSASAKAEFLNAAGEIIGSAPLDAVGAADLGGKGGLLQRQSDGTMPAAARQIVITLQFVSNDPLQFFAYADSVSFVIKSPATGLSIQSGGILNSASVAGGAVAPGEMVTIRTTGVDLESIVRMQLTQDGRVSTSLAGAKLYFDGTQAPLLYVNSSEIAAIAPFDLAGKAKADVRIDYKGVQSNTVSIDVAATAPGLFTQEGTGQGVGLIYTDGWQLVSAANPAAKGSVVTIIWTGGGQTDPGGVDGRMETQSLPKPNAGVSVKIGGQAAEVVYTGAVPYSWAGLLMAQVKVPSGVATGVVPVQLTAGGSTSQSGVTMVVK
ncbi:hypothetical protein [Paludibaculum fermentans]|uniref:DUF642 domain-containing protein n=1 Tax=Paludibaculum fermentans TaxID=1473598 RepID=A0A7S7SHI7_PALFE|nr:hypothetical protein [Paludibaculum fermentans]QOY85957.1 hypothetical protein IRI77_24490 [Paludibaculum fermentans]